MLVDIQLVDEVHIASAIKSLALVPNTTESINCLQRILLDIKNRIDEVKEVPEVKVDEPGSVEILNSFLSRKDFLYLEDEGAYVLNRYDMLVKSWEEKPSFNDIMASVLDTLEKDAKDEAYRECELGVLTWFAEGHLRRSGLAWDEEERNPGPISLLKLHLSHEDGVLSWTLEGPEPDEFILYGYNDPSDEKVEIVRTGPGVAGLLSSHVKYGSVFISAIYGEMEAKSNVVKLT